MICHTVCPCETIVNQDGVIAFGACRITKKWKKVCIWVQATIGMFLVLYQFLLPWVVKVYFLRYYEWKQLPKELPTVSSVQVRELINQKHAVPWEKNILKLSLRPLGMERKILLLHTSPQREDLVLHDSDIKFLEGIWGIATRHEELIHSLRKLKVIKSIKLSKIHWKCCIPWKILSCTCLWFDYREISLWHWRMDQ